jgi:hypothetical protein
LQAHSKGDSLVRLPEACHLTYVDTDTTDGSSSLIDIIKQVPETFWGLRLAMKVLEQRALGPSSRFAVYIQHLPITIMGLPMFFPRTVPSFHP